MATYLYMDGVDDSLKTPSIPFTEILLDFKVRHKSGKNQIYFDARSGGSFAYVQRGTSDVDVIGNTGLISVYIDDSPTTVTNNTSFVPSVQKTTMKSTFSSSVTDDVVFFNHNGGNFAPVDGDIYDIKIYNGTTLIAHYDMTTGTVLDQSGNGNHATLTGGTWLDDGTGGDTGTDVSTSFALSQQLYADTLVTAQTAQSLFADRLAEISMAQSIYADKTDSLPTYQSIYADRTVNYATLQEFFQDGIQRSTNFAIMVQLYKDAQHTHSLTQELYQTIQDYAALKQVVYAEPQFNAPLRQVISKQLTQNVATLQRMYADNQTDYPLLIQMLSDYRVYNQIIEREMMICRSFSQDLAIKRTLEKDMRI